MTTVNFPIGAIKIEEEDNDIKPDLTDLIETINDIEAETTPQEIMALNIRNAYGGVMRLTSKLFYSCARYITQFGAPKLGADLLWTGVIQFRECIEVFNEYLRDKSPIGVPAVPFMTHDACLTKCQFAGIRRASQSSTRCIGSIESVDPTNERTAAFTPLGNQPLCALEF